MKKCAAKGCLNEADEAFDSVLQSDYKRGINLCREHRRKIVIGGDVDVQRTN